MRNVFRLFYIALFFFFVVLSPFIPEVNADTASITVLTVDGTIVPVVADYINRGISEAESRNSVACIIQLNTPGGLLSTTEKIVQRIFSAKVPVIVYVYPHGAWAASAGTFITAAANIAAMAPGTTIGAAHPVGVGDQLPSDAAQKATNYSAAWIRSIAEKRGRNLDELELAVSESKSFTASQAIDNKLVDLEANDLKDLIDKLDGMKVLLADNEQVVLKTKDATVLPIEMSWIERFLHSISDPTIAYILLGLGAIGLFTEISNPGLIFPGVAGGICLFLSLYALGALNAYWAGLLLIMLAFGLFIAELFSSAFGILTAGGITSFLIGSLILFSNNPPELQLNIGLIIIVVIVVSAVFVLMIAAVVRGQKRKIETGAEGLIGKTAIAKTKLNPKGSVLVEGELWAATLEQGQAREGEEVIVTKIEGLRLTVKKKEV